MKARGQHRADFSRRLLAWFASHARDLPWRRSRDPYAIWISEVMLQQTQVSTVVPYFHRFLAAFPTLTALARADEQEVLRLWEGLGYYRRARNLHRAARLLHAEGAENLPDDPDRLSQLPGLGRYTVNAVLSQAFDRRLPIVEANTRRLLCRLFGIRQAPGEAAVVKRLWAEAEALLPADGVGDFNQALMELGALVCTPAGPRCDACPLTDHCVAFQHKLQEAIPPRNAGKRLTEVREVTVVIRRRNQFLLLQRPDTGRWSGMWEFPRTEVGAGESTEAAAERLLKGLNLEGRMRRELTVIRHGVTRFRITLTCVEVAYQRGRWRSAEYLKGRWLKATQLGEVPISSPQRRLAKLLSQ